MNILKLFAKDRETAKKDLIKNIVEYITKDWEYKFTYEEQAEMLREINEKFLSTHKDKRNELIIEAREIQNSFKKLESDEQK